MSGPAKKPRITTHIVHRTRNGDWFTAAIDGRPLAGDKGGESLFRSRREAREEALRRSEMEHNKP